MPRLAMLPRARRRARRGLRLTGASLAIAAVTCTLITQPGASADIPTQAKVDALQAKVDELALELEEATRLWQEQKSRLEVTLQKDYNAATASEQALKDLNEARAEFARFVSETYRNRKSPTTFLLLNDGLSAYVDRQLVDRALGRSAEDQRDAVQALETAQLAAAKGAELREALTLQAVEQQREADQTLREIQDKVDRGQAELEKAAADLAAEQARQAAALAATQQAAALQRAALASFDVSTIPTGNNATCLADPVDGLVANGFLHESNLCFLRMAPGHRLRPSAAGPFDALSEAYRETFGRPICVTDSYRSFAAQVDVFRRKPTLAATPGRSNHGLGLAVDLCGGIQVFRGPQHEWMRANAPSFGWVHPTWAQETGSKPEAWHWEYVGEGIGVGTPDRPSE